MPATKQYTHQELQDIANDLREDVITMLKEAGSGHSAGSLGTAELFTALYFHVLNLEADQPNNPDRDRFVLSAGHICPIYYATLSKKGFFPKTHLWKLRKMSADPNKPNLQGHPDRLKTPGVEASSGSLGQGLSQAIGMALAAKLNGRNHQIYCLTGDGELDEGQVWEAAMFAPNHKLTNLTWIIDRNNIQIGGHTEDIMPLENLREKLEAFNWHVLEIDGHNIEEIINACNMAKSVSTSPTAIIAHTIPGHGVNFMEYKFEWHGKPPNKEEARKALRQLRTLEGKIKY